MTPPKAVAEAVTVVAAVAGAIAVVVAILRSGNIAGAVAVSNVQGSEACEARQRGMRGKAARHARQEGSEACKAEIPTPNKKVNRIAT